MIVLCFGLPGTGKTTFVRKQRHQVHLDLGHNSFKSEEARSKFYAKLAKATSGIIESYSSTRRKVYWDTYPEYFDLDTLVKYASHIRINIAIPSVTTIDKIIARVGNRDGFSSEFYDLYSKHAYQWREDWINLVSNFQRVGLKVNVIDSY